MSNITVDPDPYSVHYFLTEIESNISKRDILQWMDQRPALPFAGVVVYLIGIYYGLKIMKERKEFCIKPIVFVWNLMLAVFSIITLIRVASFIQYELKSKTLQQKYCHGRLDNVTTFWIYLFAMSKFVEIGDTVLLVLRKRPVIFLHWYHHATVLLFSWFTVAQESPMGDTFAIVNAFVHSFMYTYYACQTIGIRFPRPLSMALTSLQISQMIAGLYVLFIRYDAVANKGMTCSTTPSILISGAVMYASYLYLFLYFFIQTYFLSGGKKVKKE